MKKNPNKIIMVAMDTAACLLSSGAETYRVEDTVVRVLQAYGMERANCFTTATGIMISCIYEGKTYSLVNRVLSRGTNLEKIIEVNQLSRDAKKMTIDQFSVKLNEICNLPTYSRWKNLIAAYFVAFGFVFVFDGEFPEAIFGGFVGIIVQYFTLVLQAKKINGFFSLIFTSLIITFSSLFLGALGLINSPNSLAYGTIMLLVPGLAITIAIRDTISGDLMSGISRCLEAFLIAVGTAVGSGLALKIWLFLGGGI